MCFTFVGGRTARWQRRGEEGGGRGMRRREGEEGGDGERRERRSEGRRPTVSGGRWDGGRWPLGACRLWWDAGTGWWVRCEARVKIGQRCSGSQGADRGWEGARTEGEGTEAGQLRAAPQGKTSCVPRAPALAFRSRREGKAVHRTPATGRVQHGAWCAVRLGRARAPRA